MSKNLKAGEFYGKVLNKRKILSSALFEVIHQKRVDLPAHSHELAFFTLLLDGSYSESYGRKNFSYFPMTVWWHPSNAFHKDEIGQKGVRLFTVEIESKGLENLAQFAKIPNAFYEKNTSLVRLACRLFYEFKNWQNCSELVAEGITLEMLAKAARKNNPREKNFPSWLLRVVEKLNDEFTENLSTEELAMEANVHPVHLAAVFRQFYGETMGEYVQKLRISRASQMLLDKKNSLCEIAYSTGFADQSHFTRIFKRYIGVTPGAFRNSLD